VSKKLVEMLINLSKQCCIEVHVTDRISCSSPKTCRKLLMKLFQGKTSITFVMLNQILNKFLAHKVWI